MYFGCKNFLISFVIMISSIFSLMWFRNSIIQMLLSLELLLISSFISLSLYLNTLSSFSLLFFLALMVGGSALGLSILVASSRSHHSSSPMSIFLLLFDKNHYPSQSYFGS